MSGITAVSSRAVLLPDLFALAKPRITTLVVLTTLGFGDITPTGDLARSLTVLEALLGQVFLIVLVARLVGVQIAQQQTSDSVVAAADTAGRNQPLTTPSGRKRATL